MDIDDHIIDIDKLSEESEDISRDFTVWIEHETELELALLCVFGDRQIWLPKSQISYCGSYGGVKESTINISVPDWLVKKHNL
jgi:hypothetical protein